MLNTILSLFIVLTFAKENAEANRRFKAFSCQSQHSIFDPDFIQGSEIYLDVYFFSKSGKIEVELDPMDGPAFNLYKAEDNTRSHYTNKANLFAEWKTPEWSTYVSMAYLGGPWGLATEVPESYEDKRFAGKEMEIWCKETEHTDELLKIIEK